jgi:hypothetical protein
MINFGVQHWRDGELIETIHACDVFISVKGSVMCVTMPKGLIELATEDELHINLEDLKDFLDEYYVDPRGKKSKSKKTV